MMNNQQFYYQQGEAFAEEPQQFVDSTPQMESYDAEMDDSDLPYIPSTGMSGASQYQNYQQSMHRPNPAQGFIDLSRPETYAVMNEAPMQQAMPMGMPMPLQEAKPSFDNAQSNFNMLGSMMGKISGIVSETDKDGKSVNNYATTVAVKNLKTACQMLKEVDMWIPRGKEGYAPSLKKIALPITKALEAYIQKINELS